MVEGTKRDERRGQPEEGAGRPRLVEVGTERLRGSRVRVRVVLERAGRRFEAEREGVGEDVMLVRLAAEATLEALGACIAEPERFSFIGAKRVHAFDAQVALVCVRSHRDPSRKLMGCIPATEGLPRASAVAVLHATNRIVETTPAPAGDDEG